MERSKEIEKYLYDCCCSSAIFYNKQFPSIRFLPDEGKLVYVENSRMLEIVEFQIPSWDSKSDKSLTFQILKSDPRWMYCESHKMDGKYCYSIFLIC